MRDTMDEMIRLGNDCFCGSAPLGFSRDGLIVGCVQVDPCPTLPLDDLLGVFALMLTLLCVWVIVVMRARSDQKEEDHA